jgi:hypothetical protein
VRPAPLLLLLSLCLTSVPRLLPAQQQDRRLIDRIMRPNLSLTNPAQNKTFTGANATIERKEFASHAFYSGREYRTRSYAETRELRARQFRTTKFKTRETTPNIGKVALTQVFQTKNCDFVRTSADANKSLPTHEYRGTRPFLVRGTRQEILSQESHPLTIDEVRELLNKDN